MTEPIDFGYDSYLGQVPESLRDQIEPAFKSYRDELETKYKTEADQYKPYREIEEQGWTPEHVGVGLNLLRQLNDNPQTVYNALIQEYPQLIQQQQQQASQPAVPQQQQQNTDWGSDIPPALQERLNQQEQIIQLLYQGFEQNQQQQQQTVAQQQEEAELKQFEAELDKIAPSDKYPREFILSYIARGQSPTEAIKSYSDWYSSEQARWRGGNAPLVAPANGGGLPSEPIDTSKLKDPQRRDLITQYLEAANRQ